MVTRQTTADPRVGTSVVTARAPSNIPLSPWPTFVINARLEICLEIHHNKVRQIIYDCFRGKDYEVYEETVGLSNSVSIRIADILVVDNK